MIVEPCRLIYPDARFEAMTRPLSCGCVEWIGAKSRGGGRTGTFYGTFNSKPVTKYPVRAHVWRAWRSGIIPTLRVPEGRHLEHRCNFTLCVNEEHLELITFRENIARMWERRRQRELERVLAREAA